MPRNGRCASMSITSSRKPDAAEQASLEKAFARYAERFKKDPEAAKALLKVGESPRNETLDATDHAALTSVCLTVLNLDEALNK